MPAAASAARSDAADSHRAHARAAEIRQPCHAEPLAAPFHGTKRDADRELTLTPSPQSHVLTQKRPQSAVSGKVMTSRILLSAALVVALLAAPAVCAKPMNAVKA